MRKPKSERSMVQNNVTITAGPTQPDPFISTVNHGNVGYRSILQANAQARLSEKDQEHAMRHGQPFQWSPEVHAIRQQYRKEIVDAGNSTKTKCCGDVI